MTELIKQWRARVRELEAEATQLDNQRQSFSSKYYSTMTNEEKAVWNDFRDRAYQRRLEKLVYQECADSLESYFTRNA